ncbi:hypothetical protein SAMN05421505_104122 [Sinosporangium album]|uniref:Uncharacterized protein n=1 Tax=Sinosporangium album TaxID=504805 RepID=A0A1G7U6W7_9ACTN|nr:hypothetical protein SAMN05421505_104122 [Sinosporangium album]
MRSTTLRGALATCVALLAFSAPALAAVLKPC